MVRTMKAPQKLGRTTKPWNKAVPQRIYRLATGRDPGKKSLSHHYYHPKASVLQLIRQYQKKAPKLLLNQLPFLHFTKRLARGIKKNLRFQTPAVLALQEACQAYLLELTEDWNLCAMHAKRVTVLNSDIHLARCLRREMGI